MQSQHQKAALEKGREYWKNRTHCKRGHEYTYDNVYINPTSGARQCLECLKITRPRCKKMGKEYMAKAQAEWRKRNPEKVRLIERATNLKKFGLSIVEYDEMALRQGGVCAICNKSCSSGRRLAVDHCHTTGLVRGLLCGKCNQGIGLFRDDPKLLISAVNYLTPSLKTEGGS